MSELERVLDIQVLDQALDQVPHRRERLDERAAHAEAVTAAAEAKARHEAAAARIASATQRIEELESVGVARSTKKTRLEQQLKRVIAPREAEALMHEIELLDHERSDADDEELELLDVVEQATADQDTAASDLAGASDALTERAAELAVAEAALDAERDELLAQRSAAAASVSEAALTPLRTRSGQLWRRRHFPPRRRSLRGLSPRPVPSSPRRAALGRRRRPHRVRTVWTLARTLNADVALVHRRWDRHRVERLP